MIPKQKRYISERFLEFIRSAPCLVCSRTPAEPHHFDKSKGAGGSDLGCIPLCREHHSKAHMKGKTVFSVDHYGEIGRDRRIGLLLEYIALIEGKC